MIKMLLLLALVAPLPSVSTATNPVPAQTSPQTMQLSSWQFERVDGTIVGGTQSVSIVNPSTSPVGAITFRLGIPPCECTLVATSAGDGAVADDVWTIDTLAGGATATLDLVYEADV